MSAAARAGALCLLLVAVSWATASPAALISVSPDGSPSLQQALDLRARAT